MNKKIIFIIATIIFLGAGCNQNQLANKGNGQKTSDLGSMFSVQDLVGSQNIPNAFILRGYVLDKYVCPPCPNQGFCEPCPSSDYVMVADKFAGIKGYSDS